ncbi:cytochrome c oxidase subunit II [Sulfurospirillum arcachonense]|uniref:cytochrome c oxidase subunit II n=1 Tax=Sulfurospirillum arcachonense TaxID=57666 RepID=UPI0004692137|nr:cytochrome c oxidase subunit II [Sulfurospirillum arcachonense]
MLEGMKGVSSFASEVDFAILVVVGLSIIIFLLVVGVMFYFLYKYSSKRHPRNKVKNIEHNLPLEIIWTVAPMILLAIMFYYGYSSLKAMRTIPRQNLEVKVTGQMWFWTHEYPNGKKTKDLYVPIGENIKLAVTAKTNDVLHSYYVPALRLKQDAVPGKIYNAWFKGTHTGAFDIQCAEYCGTRHAYMLAKVYVLEKDEFDKWYNSDKKTPFDKEEKTPIHPGLTLLNDNGCTGCHSLDGSPLVGPSYKGIFGRKVKVTKDGTLKEIISDEAYLKRSILDPDVEVVDGFAPGMMSSYKDVIKDEDIDKIIDYLKGGKVKKEVNIKEKALGILEANGCTGCHSLDGSPLVGPSYKGIFGRKVKVTKDGTLKEIISDEAYLKRSILDPDAEVVDGFAPGMMSSYKGVLSDEDISVLIQYFKGDSKVEPQEKKVEKATKSTVVEKVVNKVQQVVEKKVPPQDDKKTKAMSILNKNGCMGCHSLDGSRRVGPSYKGIFGRKVKVKVDGTLKEIISDEAYLKRALLEPNVEVVDTYPAIMQSYKGRISDEDISLLIEYFKGL